MAFRSTSNNENGLPNSPPDSPLFSSPPPSVNVPSQSSPEVKPTSPQCSVVDRGRSFSPRSFSRSVTPPCLALSQSLPVPVFSKALSPHHHHHTPCIGRSRSEVPSRRSQSHRWRNRKRARQSDSEDSDSDHSNVEFNKRRPHWRYDSPSEHHAHSLSSFLRSRSNRASISTFDSRVEVLTESDAAKKEEPPSIDTSTDDVSASLSSLHVSTPRACDKVSSSASPPVLSRLPSPSHSVERLSTSVSTTQSQPSAPSKIPSSGSTITDDVVAALGALASSPPPPPPPATTSESSTIPPTSCTGLNVSRPFSWKRVAPPPALPVLVERRDMMAAGRGRGVTSLPTLVRAAEEAFASSEGRTRVMSPRPRAPAVSTDSTRTLTTTLPSVPPPPPLVAPAQSSVRMCVENGAGNSSTSTSSSLSQKERSGRPTSIVAPPPPPPPPVSALAPLPLSRIPRGMRSPVSSSSATVRTQHSPQSLYSRDELGGTRVHAPFTRSLSHSPTHGRSSSSLNRRSRFSTTAALQFWNHLHKSSDIPSAFTSGPQTPTTTSSSSSSSSHVPPPIIVQRPQTPPPTLANALAQQMQRHTAISRPGMSLEHTPLHVTSSHASATPLHVSSTLSPTAALHVSSAHSSHAATINVSSSATSAPTPITPHVPPPPPLSTIPLVTSTSTGVMPPVSLPSAFSSGPVTSNLTADVLHSQVALNSVQGLPTNGGVDLGMDSDTASQDSLTPENMSVSDMQDFMIECTDNGDLESLVNFAKKHGRLLPVTRKTLHYCCRSRHPKIAKFILSQDCDPDARNAHGRTPLIDICANPLPFDYAQAPLRMISHLILAGANLEAQDSHNNTAVQWASSFFNTEATLQLLVSQGANIHHKSRHFQSAHEMAHLSGVKLSALKFGQYQFRVRIRRYRRALNNHCQRYQEKELRNFPNDLTNLIVYGFIFGHKSPKVKRSIKFDQNSDKKTSPVITPRGTRSSARLRENSRRVNNGRKRQRIM